jgi:hypothetical protein
MAKPPDSPVDHRRGGNYAVQGPSITVTPAEDVPARPAPGPLFRQVGEAVLDSVTPPPGTTSS